MTLRGQVLRGKRALFWLVDLTAVAEFLLHRRRPREGLTILCYHRVADGLPAHPPENPYNVTPAQFGRQLDALAVLAGTRVVSAADVAGWLRQGRVPSGAHVMLTFDDGFANVLPAARALRERGLGAAFFVVTGYVGRPSLDFNSFDRWVVDQPGADPAWYRPVTADECRALLALGMDVQPHGHTHRKMGLLPDDELAREVRQSRDFIAGELGQPALGFCYPFGSSMLGDVSDAVEARVAAEGFAFALATDAGSNGPQDVVRRRYRLRRIPVNDYDAGLFMQAKAAGYCGLLPVAKTLLHRLVLRHTRVRQPPSTAPAS